MVRRCAWGTCNADCRYPDKMIWVRFITFPNPKTQFEKCLRWIKACARPHEQLNVNRINKNKVVCSTHFMGENGPTDKYPDPLPADGSLASPTRPPPKRRRLDLEAPISFDILVEQEKNKENVQTNQNDGNQRDYELSGQCEVGCQTDKENQDVHLHEENLQLKIQLLEKDKEINRLKSKLQHLERDMKKKQTFSAEGIRNREKDMKTLFKYYTGITYVNFFFLFSFLFPNPQETVKYGRKDTKLLSNENALLLVLCRLRHDFGLKDLAMRFSLSLQSTGIVFNKLLDILYFKFGQISLWPPRDDIISRMPAEFRKDCPTTLIMIDGTEFKTQVPNALALQSQMYSDYKSSTTLKALIGCDPSGSVIFISELFTGSISDKMICEESGFYAILKDLLNHGYINPVDGIMADKGFTIQKELNKLGLVLNIPPFSSCSSQMSSFDTYLTQKNCQTPSSC
ncbi:uncharacterized protein LOC132757648 [Ruditapes philippinarum]|uniref:uncharacterized protein LOC132757648 n=1 Tax=Ruditapes philippinarum TaxID=129788 RepID=UPI00295A7259|nr:uncharacterized protein LOC132757648 [Ruditapes philippinarum]